MLRACCCPQKNAVATAAIVPSQEQTAHSSAQEAQSQSEAALVSREGDNGPSAEDVDDYARNVLGMDVEKHPQVETNCAPQACVPVVVAVPVEVAQP